MQSLDSQPNPATLNSNLTSARNCRSLHTKGTVSSSAKDGNASNSTLDEFRANEERIEREYEEQQQKLNEQQKGEKEKQKQSTNGNDEDHEKIQLIRTRILDAALPFVNKHGWSREAIVCGAESINYPSVVHGMFPNGNIELIHHFYTKCNRALIDLLQEQLKENEKNNGNGTHHVNPVEFSTNAIRQRLQMIVPYADTWPQAMAIMTLPKNAPTSLAQLLTLVDDICYLAGDRSVDVSAKSLIQLFFFSYQF